MLFSSDFSSYSIAVIYATAFLKTLDFFAGSGAAVLVDDLIAVCFLIDLLTYSSSALSLDYSS
jgi:hypothetical protein